MLVPANKRVCEVPAIYCPTTVTQAGYKTAAPGGPAGSALFTFACAFETFTPGISSSYNNLWNRWNGANAGWWMRCVSTATNTTPVLVECGAHNGAGGFVSTTLAAYPLKQMVIVIGRWNSGAMSQWVNGVFTSTISSGAGFSAFAGATMIGCNVTAAANNARNSRIGECVFLDTYDVATYNNPLYGTGAAGLYAQWAEQLQQGQYLTPPSGVWGANDAYWSSRDVVQGVSTETTWLDRSTNLYSMARTGTVLGASMIPRFQ